MSSTSPSVVTQPARAAMMTHMLGLYHEIQAIDDQDGTAHRHICSPLCIEDEPEWHHR
jgi:hypothetical protein